MPGALAGVASCARCGSMQTTAGVLCQSCGTALTPAARGSVLGTYTPLIAGVARTNALRGYLTGLIDALPLAVAAAVAVVTAASGAFGRWPGLAYSAPFSLLASCCCLSAAAAPWVVLP